MRFRTRWWVVVAVVGVAAVVAAAILSMRPSLTDAEDVAESQWTEAGPRLDARYEALGELSLLVREAAGGSDLLDEVDGAVDEWGEVTGASGPPRPRREVPVANRAEAAGARLAVSIVDRPSLARDGDVVAALRAYLDTDPSSEVGAYGDAVRRYDEARARFPGRFLADLLGFEELDTVEIPAALDDLEVPTAPA